MILALTIVNIGVNGTKGPVWAMPSMFLTGASAAAGIALINSMGNLGGFVGPVLIGWMKDRWGAMRWVWTWWAALCAHVGGGGGDAGAADGWAGGDSGIIAPCKNSFIAAWMVGPQSTW